MPYIVKVGVVLASGRTYRVGETLPEGIGDAAMAAAGSVEWSEPKPPRRPRKSAKAAK